MSALLGLENEYGEPLAEHDCAHCNDEGWTDKDSGELGDACAGPRWCLLCVRGVTLRALEFASCSTRPLSYFLDRSVHEHARYLGILE
jgi:hypothetical protein